MRSMWMAGMIGLPLALAGQGCATQSPGDGDQGEIVEEVALGAPIYNGTGRCTVGGITMHCCPSGMAMVGAHIGKDVFKCAPFPTLGAPFLDRTTRRNGMAACPQGALMIGLHVDLTALACQFSNPPTTHGGEFVDYTTRDSFVMHVCGLPGIAAMAGIHVDHDLFTCDT